MPLVLGSNSASAGGYNVANSLRFNSGSSDFLNRTPASTTDQKTFTISAWVKLSTLSNVDNNAIFNAYISGVQVTTFFFYFEQLWFYHYDSSFLISVRSTQLFRDTSAWYHVMASVDTTQATSTNRVKLYVNGSQITDLSANTYGSQNQTTFINSTVSHTIGRETPSQSYLGGYLSEYYFIDGQQLTPSSFGETDTDTNIWIPKAYTGSFGTNGFYLQFKNSGSLGLDSSGNGNNFTVNNLTSVDQSTDTCTNNFATLNPLANFRAGATITEGNLKASLTTTKAGVPATVGVSTGKWYWENKIDTLPVDGRFAIGIVPFEPVEADDLYNANNKGIAINGFNSVIYASNNIIDNFYGNATGRWSGFTGIIGVALDLSSGTKTIAMSKDGAWITGSNTTDSNFSNALKVDITSYVNAYDFWNPIIGSSNGSGTTGVLSMNFGNPPFTIASGNADAEGFGNFEYAVPAGYFALCSKNLAEYA